MKFRLLLALLIALVASSSYAVEPSYANDFEYDTPLISGTTYQFPWPKNTNPTVYLNGLCWRKAAGDPFDSISISTRHAATGTKSMRVENRNDRPNMRSNHCPYGYQNNDPKVRNEVLFGWDSDSDISTYPWGEIPQGDPGRWMAFEMLIPDDEGNYPYWVTQGNPRTFIFQVYAHDGTASPELHGLIGKNLNLNVQLEHSIAEGKEDKKRTNFYKNLLPNRWNQFLIWYKRDWNTSGEMKMWINPDSWPDAESTPDFVKTGGVGIRIGGEASFRVGLYRAAYDDGIDQTAYFDNVRLFPSTASWADVTENFSGQTSLPPPTTQTASITSVNSGATIAIGDDNVPFEVENATMVNGGYLGSDPANWFPTGWHFSSLADTGCMDLSNVTTPASIPANLTFYYEPYAVNSTLASGSWIDNAQIVLSDAAADWCYTNGLKITADGTPGARVYSHRSVGYTGAVTVGQRMAVTMVYTLEGGADEAGVHLEDGFGNWIGFWGTPGAMVEDTSAPGSRFGTGRKINERDMGNGYWSATLSWVVASGDKLNGWTYRPLLKSPAVGESMTIRELYLKHDWTTKTVSTTVQMAVSDVTPPLIENAFASLDYIGDQDGDGVASNNYAFDYSAGTSEIGGDWFFYKNNSVSPPTVTNLKACTGANWCTSQPADERTISFSVNGVEFVDQCIHALRTDAAGLDSQIQTTCVYAGVSAGNRKVFDFKNQYNGPGTDRRITYAGAYYNSATYGNLDSIAFYTEDPKCIRLKECELDDVYIGEAKDVSGIAEGVVQIDQDDLDQGDMNALTIQQYYWFQIENASPHIVLKGRMRLTEVD